MGDYKKVIGIGTAMLLTLVILAALFPVLQDEGQGLTDEGMCGDNSCFYNASRSVDCTMTNKTAADTTLCTRGTYVPGGLPNTSGLGTGGFIWVILSIIVLIAFIAIIFKIKASK